MTSSRVTLVVALLLLCTSAKSRKDRSVNDLQEDVDSHRDKRLLSLFQVVTFRNEGCIGNGNRNGTCYTSAECTSRGGTSSGSCADGFGVCCIFSLGCGEMTRDNCTYLSLAASETATSPCQYTVCKCSDDICRIRFDFMTFEINGPVQGTAVQVSTVAPIVAAPLNNGGSIGDCTTDTFTITSPGNIAPPVICGMNSGQHMYVDASDACHIATFALGGTASRSWDIKVSQYRCGDEDGGPDGCLQWFTENTGTFASFNYPLSDTTTTSVSTTHLSNQCYTMCFRQNAGKCAICYRAQVTGSGDGSASGSFGLSNSFRPDAKGEIDSRCLSDFLRIPGAEPVKITQTYVPRNPVDGTETVNRICGRFFNANDMVGDRNSNNPSVCTSQSPFTVQFKSDDDEVVEAEIAGIAEKAQVNEQAQIPGGIVGFYLRYELIDC